MTTLTTVGLGDYHPVQNIEYVVGAFMLLFGVLIFSYFMMILIGLMFKYKKHVNDFDKGDELAHFIGTLSRFNYNEDINMTTKKSIEKYFDYRWNNYKNQAFSEAEDLTLLDQMPDSFKLEIFTKFAYPDFLVSFKRFFDVLNPDYPLYSMNEITQKEVLRTNVYFKWTNEVY